MSVFLSRILLVWLISFASVAANYDEQPVKMGPLLHFNGIDKENHMLSLGALYLLKTQSSFPEVRVFDKEVITVVAGEVIGEKFGYSFVRYKIQMPQGKKSRFVEYELAGYERFPFYVPSVFEEPRIAYHSCNGYQYTADRDRVGGISPMWQKILASHSKKPYTMQFGGGDQIYADGLILGDSCASEPAIGDTHGVFALKTMQAWLKDQDNLRTAKFTKAMRAEVEAFYFNQYVNHYNEAGFKEANAQIPGIFQPDDHDFYDGCGSYPEDLQNSPVLASIREIARSYVFLIQHQLSDKESPRDDYLKPRAYNYLHTLGSLAIMAVDTRTERTESQILSESSWMEVFAMLENIGPEVNHVMVMLGVPLVYASSNSLESAVGIAESIPFFGGMLERIPGFKNAFGLFELADDGRDGWCHKAHIDERNQLVFRLQKFAARKGVRATLVGGDVHLGGAGKIYSNECGFDDCSSTAIYQVISSPVGNAPVGKTSAKAIALKGCCEQSLDNDCSMCLFRMEREDGGKASTLISERNFASFQIDSSKTLQMRLTTETSGAVYVLDIPKLEH